MTISKRTLTHSEALKTQVRRYGEFGTPAWAVLLAAVMAMAVSGSLASVPARVHSPTVQVSRPSVERVVLL
jgi:hypothetical protein